MVDEEKLICLVQMYDCLYNTKSRHYSNKHMKNNAWQKVGAEMNMSSVEDCQKSWKKLRDSYRKGISLRESRSGSARTVGRPLKFEKELEFIKPFIKSRKQISNLTSSLEDSDITTDGEYQSMSQRPSPRPQSQISASPRPQSQLSNRTSSSNEQPLKMSNLLFKQYIEGKQIEDDPTISFFITMGRTVKTMPKNIQAKLKGEIFRLINETEIRLADDTGGNMTRNTDEFNLSATENNTTMPSSSKYPLETTSISPRSVTENYNETNIPTTSFSYTPSIIPAAEQKSITSFSYKPSKIPSTSTSYQETNTENIYETNSPLPIYSNLTSRSSSLDPPPSPYIPRVISKSQRRIDIGFVILFAQYRIRGSSLILYCAKRITKPISIRHLTIKKLLST